VNAPDPDFVASPCRDICRLDAAGVCIGCGRTGSEIGEWPRASAQRRREIRVIASLRLEKSSEAAQGGEVVDRGAR
jgi:uncharacterized protein